MAINQSVDISAPVGETPRTSKGKEPKNKSADVKIVQELLKAAGMKCAVNGKVDDKTIEAIKKFQKTKAKLKKPDGVVDPGKKTIAKLNEINAESAGGDEAEEEKPKAKKVNVSYTVPAYKQPTNMSCWATAIAMMVSYKKKMSIAPATIAEVLGYTEEFKTGGLDPQDTEAFKRWNMKWDAPMCYSIQGFADTLKSRGPLWVAGNPKAPHVRVVTGIAGDGTADGTKVSINDPAGGKKYKVTYRKFADTMEGLGASEMELKSPIYVAYMK